MAVSVLAEILAVLRKRGGKNMQPLATKRRDKLLDRDIRFKRLISKGLWGLNRIRIFPAKIGARLPRKNEQQTSKHCLNFDI
jgi:hypothetical protein